MDDIQKPFTLLVSFVSCLFLSVFLLHNYSAKALISIKLAFLVLVYISSLFMKYLYLTSISAILLILVHSFYSWDQNHKGDHLVTSFQQFIQSSHPQVIASAVEQAIKSCGEDHGLLCEEIIKIVWKHPLGKLTFKIVFNFYSCITEHPTLMKAYSLNTNQATANQVTANQATASQATANQAIANQATAKRTIPQRLRRLFRHL